MREYDSVEEHDSLECDVRDELDMRDELDISDMLSLFGHNALGISFCDAKEIDPYYGRDI